MTEPKSVSNVGIAISKVMENIPKLQRTEKNTHGSYNFASIDDFLEAVRPLCAEQGLIIDQDEETVEILDGTDRNGKPLRWLKIRWSFTPTHTSGETWPTRYRTSWVNASMGAQAFGAAQSYALKQYMRSLFQIATGEKGQDVDEYNTGHLPADNKPSAGAPKTEKPEERPTSSTGGAATNGDGGGKTKEWINVFTKQGNHQTFERNVGGARQAVSYLEELMAEDPTVWWANEEWAAEICAKIGTAKDPDLKDETKAKLTLAERLQFLESQAPDQANILDAG